MTGAPIPAGLDAVCMVERTRPIADGARVVIEDTVAPGDSVRPPGDDVRAGSVVATDGAVLAAAHLGCCRASGWARSRSRCGRGRVMSTGDEIVEGTGRWPRARSATGTGPRCSPWFDRRALRPSISASWATTPRRSSRPSVRRRQAVTRSPITSGGVSVGDLDVVKDVLTTLAGERMWWLQVAIRPAKPFAFGLLDDGRFPVFGLPGTRCRPSSPSSCSLGPPFA